jgi:hypothetical protein
MQQRTRHSAPFVIYAASCATLALFAGACSSKDPSQSSASPPVTTAAPTTSEAPPASTAVPSTPAVKVTASTTAAPTSTEVGQEVQFEFTTGGEAVSPIAAQSCSADGQACLLPLGAQPARFDGDLVGDVVAQSSISTRGDRISSVAHLVFSGTLADCGTGTVALVVAGSFRLDGSTAIDGLYTWSILDGSGTGALVGATGAGEGTEGLGPLHGRISCG